MNEKNREIINLLKYTNKIHLQKEGVSQEFLNSLTRCFPNKIVHNFQGVFNLTQAEKRICTLKKEEEFCCIINLCTDEDVERGQVGHFVSIIKRKNGALMYLDPFGLPAIHKGAKTFMRAISKNKFILYNKKCVQSMTSSFCGLYALLFLLKMAGQKKEEEEKYAWEKKNIFFNENDMDGKNDERCLKYINHIVKNM